MRLGTCVAVELVVGGALAAGLTVSAAWGIGEVRRHLGDDVEPDGARARTPADTPDTPLIAPALTPVEPLLAADDELGAPTLGAADPGTASAPSGTAPAGLGAGLVATSPAVAAGAVPLTEGGLPPDAAAALPATPPTPPVTIGAPPFDATADDVLLAPLRTAALKSVKVNRGGTSISLRLDFEGGGRASFKPEQTNPQSPPRKEIAAYRIDRLLGINAVSPAFARAFTVEELYGALEDAGSFMSRLRAEMISRRDPEDRKRRLIVGEVQWWIPVIADAKIGKYRIDETDGVVTWKRRLRVGATIPAADYELVRQISTMILFDFLIDNTDRWSGSNARISADGSKLYFMDNTLSFTKDDNGHHKSQGYIERSQVFSRHLVGQLRALTEEKLRAVLEPDHDPIESLLTDEELAALLGRRKAILIYVDKLIAQHGEAAVLVFP